jgi:hypothetical protein
MRDLSAEAITLLASERIQIEYFYEGVFSESTLRLWTGNYDLVLDGETYYGNGWLMEPDGWKETLFNQPFGQQITLSGVPLSLIAVLLTQVRQTNTGRIGILFFDADGEYVDYFDSFSGRLDKVSGSEGPTTSSLTLNYESKLINMSQPRDLRLTDASHRADFPTDKGFEYLSQISGKRIYWGKPDTSRS